MKIIGALGGGGSSFVLRSLERLNYSFLPGHYDPYPLKRHLEKCEFLLGPFHLALRVFGAYRPRLMVLKRPDSFWTDWRYHPRAVYDPQSPTFTADLRGQRDYLVTTRRTRSAGLPIRARDLSTESHVALVRSYLERLRALEQAGGFQVVLVCGHWAEYGILADLGTETVYLIRDPFNSLVSHSKDIRHGKDYRRRGLEDINSRAWIDAYLSGPHHYWIGFAEAALRHPNATIVRYHRLREDWRRVTGLPDISDRFTNRENDIAGILTCDSIEYIHERTQHVCGQLGFDELCRKYLNT
jgi:hypothetical protein